MDEISQDTSRPQRRYLPWVITVVALTALVITLVPRDGASKAAAEAGDDAVASGAVQGGAALGGGLFGATRSSGGAVMVDLTPKAFADGRLTVSIRVTTHTVNDLDTYDLTKIVRLVAGGNEAAPVSAPELRGHHNSGELVFPLETLPDSFSIEIHDLNTPGVRTFAWP